MSASSKDSATPGGPGGELALLCSAQFLAVYLLTVTKSYSNIFIGQNLKEFGLALVGDDYFVTKVTMMGGTFNLIARFSMGWLHKALGFRRLYLLNMGLEMTYLAILIYFARSRVGFSVFAFIWRASSGTPGNEACTSFCATSPAPGSGDSARGCA